MLIGKYGFYRSFSISRSTVDTFPSKIKVKSEKETKVFSNIASLHIRQWDVICSPHSEIQARTSTPTMQ